MKKIIPFVLAFAGLTTVLATNAKADDPIAAWNQIADKAVKTAGPCTAGCRLGFMTPLNL